MPNLKKQIQIEKVTEINNNNLVKKILYSKVLHESSYSMIIPVELQPETSVIPQEL